MKRKLIEVALPLDAINAASAREKSIRHGHPSTLHLWWARRPLAACRAVLFAQLVDDPSSHPDRFPTQDAVDKERQRLFAIIEDLVKWENSTNEEVLASARAEIVRSCDGELPPIYDPFSGGGSIPLEAQRLGLPAHGSDLNPVAVMIGKAMVEIPPLFKDQLPAHPGPTEQNHYRNAEGLAEDVKYYGAWMRERAIERIGHLYPQIELPKANGGGKATVIAWIWARTVPSPDPAFSDVQVPLVRSFDLSTKKDKKTWVEPIIEGKDYRFEIRSELKGDNRHHLEGTVNRRGGTCLVSGAAMPFPYIRAQGREGKMGQRLMAIVVEGPKGRVYLNPTEEMQLIAESTIPANVPESRLPKKALGFRVQEYGMLSHKDLFTDRQLIALSTFSDLVHEARSEIERDALAAGFSDDQTPLRDGGTGAEAYAEAVSVYLGFALDRSADAWSAQVTWRHSVEASRSTFSRQALPMVWDFVELNPFSSSNGNWSDASVNWVQESIIGFAGIPTGKISQIDAQSVSFPNGTVISTDPPYYDNIGYADLSDFFFCWMRPSLQSIYPDLFGVLATPKQEELVATPYRHENKKAAETFFLDGMSKAIANMAQQSSNDFPATIYYAFKQSEIDAEGISSTGWATFLQAVIDAGYSVVGTWPMRTEKPGRMVSVGTNALANSVVLVCRKKEDSAEILSRSEFIRTLKRELPPAIETLRKSYIAPADMPQAAIGPGMGIFSRCKAVLEAADTPMSVKTALQLINRELDEYLGGIQGEFDAETRFALTWFEQYGMTTGDFGSANNIATARGISVDSVRNAGIVQSSGGKVRILGRDEIDPNWYPAEDKQLSVWECSQHLVRALEHDGENGAAMLLKRVGLRNADSARDLAYCLYDIAANKRNDSAEAAAWNGLITVWSELTRQAASIHDIPGEYQEELEV